MRPCGYIVRRICCAILGSVGLPLTRQRRENLTGAAIGDPTEETGKGTGGTSPSRTRRDRTTVVAQDVVVEEAVTLVEDKMGQTAEADVCEGVMTITPTPPPPPTRTDRGCGAAVRNVGTEIGRRRNKN